MGDIIYSITAIFQILVFLLTIYYFLIAVFGIYRKKEVKDYNPKNKFAMIVAAHDEEVVIGKLIESMQNQNYPKELYDIYVIADNCTDNTAKISKSYGVNVYERVNKDQRGKGYALEWMFEKLFKLDKKYDAVCIFDADNLVDQNFLREINSKMKEGYRVVQGYIDSKNPNDSWIATSYSIAFWSQNRMFQLARKNLGLSNQLGGTGFAVDVELLKKLGWGATCLTEDLEFSCKLILNGERIGWAHDAKIYDEKPLTLKASWIQRRRWMQGFSDVALRYFTKLFKAGIKNRKWRYFDGMLYIIQPFITILLGISFLLGILQGIIPHGDNIFMISDLIGNVGLKVFVVVQFIITPLVLILDKQITKTMFFMMVLLSTNTIIMPIIGIAVKDPTVLSIINYGFYVVLGILALIIMGKKQGMFFIRFILYSWYTLTWIPITIQGIARRNNKDWHRTEHVRNVEICDVKS